MGLGAHFPAHVDRPWAGFPQSCPSPDVSKLPQCRLWLGSGAHVGSSGIRPDPSRMRYGTHVVEPPHRSFCCTAPQLSRLTSTIAANRPRVVFNWPQIGANQPEFGRNRPTFCRTRPFFVRPVQIWSNTPRIRPDSGRTRHLWSNASQIWPESLRVWSKLHKRSRNCAKFGRPHTLQIWLKPPRRESKAPGCGCHGASMGLLCG